MRRISGALAGVGALVVGMTLWTATPSPAHDMGGPLGGFVDEDGDGINDFTARGHFLEGRMGVNLSSLTLTADQQTKVDKLKTDHQTAVTPLQTTLQTKETELRTLIKATTPDQTAINAKIAEINGIRSQIQTADAAYATSVLNLLTADQRGTLDAQRLGLTRAGLTLTADQLTQIDKLTSGHETAASALQTTLQTKETELRTLMSATSPDKTAINAKIDEISSIQAQLQKEDAGFQVAVRGVLTADQQAALDAARTANAGFGPGGRGPGRGPMGHGRR